MAENAKSTRVTTDNIDQTRKQLSNLYRQRQIECDHKTNNGPTLYDPSAPEVKHLINGFTRQFNDTDMVCSICGEVINMESVSRDEADGAFQTLYDVCNQTKVLCGLNEREKESIEEIIQNLDAIKNSLMPFYNENLIKPLTGQGKGKKNNNTRTKGKMGINSSSYSRR